ncbi:MAG: DNA methyltransferase [bacterium]
MTLKNHDILSKLYSKSLPASRSGPLFSCFSYPTKISPESIAVFIASHTKPGDTVLDVFGGSCTTGLAAMLCANPPQDVIQLAQQLKAPVQWGPRKAIIYELSTMGAFIGQNMINHPEPNEFLDEAEALITRCEKRLSNIYTAKGPNGEQGIIRYAVWTEFVECLHCGTSTSFWNAAVRFNPLKLTKLSKCPKCGKFSPIDKMPRSEEKFYDPFLGTQAVRRRREIAMIYGRSGQTNWKRCATPEDITIANSALQSHVPACAPITPIPWGDLYRNGYHTGMTHAHHFYTPRNWLVMATIWSEIENSPKPMRDALKLLALSYNATHATLMTRVVIKNGQSDFVLTGAQSGVLYVSGLPVEKNIFNGLRRKAVTISRAFMAINGPSYVRVINGSSRYLDLPDKSVNYVFTDPPFGGFIPYAEINYLNEIWLGKVTNRKEEIIISTAQGKSVDNYSSLMSDVFQEITRVLKDDGTATVVFHSAQADVWRSLQAACSAANLRIELSGVLDKLQSSFKQANSEISVKGDPLFLLSKMNTEKDCIYKYADIEVILSQLLKKAVKAEDCKERTPERLYSRFVSYCMKNDISITMDAPEFYGRAKTLLRY